MGFPTTRAFVRAARTAAFGAVAAAVTAVTVFVGNGAGLSAPEYDPNASTWVTLILGSAIAGLDKFLRTKGVY